MKQRLLSARLWLAAALILIAAVCILRPYRALLNAPRGELTEKYGSELKASYKVSSPGTKKTMEQQLEEKRAYIADIEGIGAHMDEYPCELGVLTVQRTPSPSVGVQYSATLFRNDGTSFCINSLLPACWHPYFNPYNIQISEDGTILTFISPIEEGIDAMSTTKWGDTLCTVDLVSEEMISMEPLNP